MGATRSRSFPANERIEDLGPQFDSGPDAFIDTAGVMANLDLDHTSDTAMAHVAGGLGRPVWLLLKTVPEWRWSSVGTTAPGIRPCACSGNAAMATGTMS